MSLRLRIFLAFAVLALLPALPVTWAVRDLIDKSFEVGLSPEVQKGLDGGAETARRWLRGERYEFRARVDMLALRARQLYGRQGNLMFIDELALPELSLPDVRLVRLDTDGAVIRQRGDWSEIELSNLRTEAMTLAPASAAAEVDALYPPGPDRLALRAVIPLGDPVAGWLLISNPLETAFLKEFGDIVSAQQLLASLSLEQERLRRGFVLPFLVVYALMLLLSLLMAWLLSRRLTGGLAALVAGARRIGGGDWTARVSPAGRDEVGRVARAFNDMAGNLDSQARRLTDLEKMAAWREMARGLAHEIKNPLTPIGLVMQELRDRYTGGDGEYREFLDESGRIVEEEIDSLRRLSREFSEFARTPEMHKTPSDLNGLVRDLARLYGSVPVELDLDSALASFAFDAEQMRRALSNLFENAVGALAAMPESERRIVVSTQVEAVSEGDSCVRLEFTDSGPGVPEEIRARIFEPHFTTKGSGMGLGLALVRSVVTLHGGNVELGAGPGARFLIRLPLADHDVHKDPEAAGREALKAEVHQSIVKGEKERS